MLLISNSVEYANTEGVPIYSKGEVSEQLIPFYSSSDYNAPLLELGGETGVLNSGLQVEKKSLWWLWLIILVIISYGGYRYYKKNKKNISKNGYKKRF